MRRAFKIVLALLALLLLATGAGLLVLRTAWFREELRQRVIAELENATGGQVEIARVRFNVPHRRGRLEGLTIHGSEGPGQPPLLHAAALEVDLKVVSFLERRVDVAALRLYSPQIHIRVAADGSTNIPEPKGQGPARPLAEQLLDLAAGRFEVDHGALWWNDQSYALDVALSDVRAQLRLEQRDHRYAGHVETGRVAVPSAGPLARPPAIEHVAGEFQLSHDHIEVSELAAKSALSQCRLHGSITDLRRPRWQFEYEAEVDARELGDAVPVAEVKAGSIHFKGSFESGPGENRPIPNPRGGSLRPGPRMLLGAAWVAQGKLAGHGLAVAGKSFRLRDVALEGEYHADPRELRADDLVVRLLGGEWKGRLTAEYAESGQPIRAGVEGRLAGVRLEWAEEAFSTSQYPLGRLRWAAVVGGPFRAQVALPLSARDLSAQADLTLTAPENPGALSPLQGVLRASYKGRDSEMQLSEARLAIGATSVSATGRIREQSSDVQFRVQTARLEDLTGPAAVFSGEKIEPPIRLDGRAVVQGRLDGTLQAPEIDAAVDLSRFAYEGRAWDSFTGRVQWSRRRLRLIAGRLTKDKTAVNANLTAGLDNGRFTDRSPLEADVSVRDTQLQDLAALAGQKVPLTGAVTAALKVQGTQKNLRGTGRLQIRRGTAWEEPFDSFRASIALDAGEVRLNDAEISKAKNTVTGSGAFHTERKTFRFEAHGENLALADFRRLSGGEKKLTASGSFTMTGSGRFAPQTASLEEVALEGNLRLQKVSLDGNALGDLSASVRNDAGKLRIDLQSDFGGGQITASGEVVPHDRFPVQGRADLRDLKVAPLLRMAGVAESPPQILADGNFAVTGEALRPETISASGSLTRLEVEWPVSLVGSGAGKLGVQKLRSVEPVKWAVANRKLTVDTLHLVGEGSDLRSSGWAELRPAGAVNFSVRGGLNLAVLGSLGPNLQFGGSSTVDAAISGPFRRPDIRGSIAIQNASLGSEDAPISLSNGSGVIAFSSQRATIQKFTAEVGGGQISVSGDAAFAGGPVTYHLRANARQVRLRYPRGLSTVLEGTLTFTGTNQQSVLGGQIQVARAGTTTALDLGAVLAGLRQPTRTPSRNDWLQGAQLNVNIITAPDIRFETTLAHNLQADANLRLRGTALNPALLGRINITQGELQFQGTRYSLNRGSITFANPFRIEPILNLDLQTRVSGYDITLTLAGPLQNLNVSYRSDPPLPFNELITLLAVGRAPTTDPVIAAQQSAQARSLTQLGASSVIGQAIASPPGGGRLQRFFGVSRLKFDPELAGPEGNLGARVTLEQQVGRDITFTYVYNLASAQEQIVRVQWAISRQFSIIAVRDQNGVFGVDFLYRRRYR